MRIRGFPTNVDRTKSSVKVIISLIFGICGFLLNFYSFDFYFGTQRATFLLGLTFPLIIAVAWGWRYGLVSSVLGLGCQTMWFLWAPASGWAALISVPPFTLWVLWHGWCSERYKHTGQIRYHQYFVEIPFRLFNIILLFLVFPLFFQFNPSTWFPNANASVELSYINFINMKETINAFVVLLTIDLLLNIDTIRRFFKLETLLSQKNTTYIISGMLFLGCSFWFIDAYFSSVYFFSEIQFVDLLFLNIPPHMLFSRTTFIIGMLMAGLVSSKFLRRKIEAEENLRTLNEQLERRVEERTKEIESMRDELIRNERLAVLGNLAAGVSHELRNPLSSIKCAAYYLTNELENTDQNIIEALQIMETEIAESEYIISSLLAFSEYKDSTFKEVKIQESIQEALTHVRIPPDVKILTKFDTRIFTIMANPNQIKRVFASIIRNAIHAMPLGGQLTIESKTNEPDWFVMSFADTGIGIAEKDLPNIFEPFFTTKAKGIGLDLTIVKIVIECLEGKIEVESELNIGTTFMVKLPMKIYD